MNRNTAKGFACYLAAMELRGDVLMSELVTAKANGDKETEDYVTGELAGINECLYSLCSVLDKVFGEEDRLSIVHDADKMRREYTK